MLFQPIDQFEWVQAGGGAGLRCRVLHRLADHLFTTRPWRLGAADAKGGDGWLDVAAALGVDLPSLARLNQMHGAAVVVATARNAADRPEADIIITSDPTIALAVQSADCVPLLMADSRTGAVAAAHAGWRGLAARVPQATVAALAREFGSRPADLTVAIGPSISACCYEVGSDVRDAMLGAGFAGHVVGSWFADGPQPSPVNPSMPSLPSIRRPNHWFFDPWPAARHQLEDAGVPPSHIHVASLCTASHPDVFCSYRRDGKAAGRMAAVIRARQS